MKGLIKPVILVSLKTELTGGVKHTVRQLNPDKTGATRWETKRETEDPDEHARAMRARANAASVIRAICADTSYGLVMPASDEALLKEAIDKSQSIVKEYNEGAEHTHVYVYVLPSDLRAEDPNTVSLLVQEAIAAFEFLTCGMEQKNSIMVREGAVKAKSLIGIFEDKQARALFSAVEAARKIARQISKSGEFSPSFAEEIDRAKSVFCELEPLSEPVPELVQDSSVSVSNGHVEEPAPATLPGAALWDGPVLPGINPQRVAEYSLVSNDR